MHRRLLNQARLQISLAPRGPVLIKSGQESIDPTRVGMEFVRTRHARAGDTVYLPGTSLKGALRSQGERALQGLGIRVCDPLDRRLACKAPRGRVSTPEVYRAQCPACRTFGSLAVGGRCNVLDAYPWKTDANDDEIEEAVSVANRTERRNQVGIDRATGEAHPGTLFDLEVVVAGEFHTEVHLQNFQLWQLGLVAAALQDIDDGYVPIGFGKSRGLGQMAVRFHRLEVEMTGDATDHLRGAGALCTTQERQDYDLQDGDEAALPDGVRAEKTWRGCRLSASGAEVEQVLGAAVSRPLASFTASRKAGGGKEAKP